MSLVSLASLEKLVKSKESACPQYGLRVGKITADALFNINNYFNDSTTKNKIKLARFHRRSLGSVDQAKLLNR